jgi:hypothetical protein
MVDPLGNSAGIFKKDPNTGKEKKVSDFGDKQGFDVVITGPSNEDGSMNQQGVSMVVYELVNGERGENTVGSNNNKSSLTQNEDVDGFRGFLNSTGNTRNMVAMEATLVDNASQMTTKGFIPSPPVPTSVLKAVNTINSIGKFAFYASKALGVVSVMEHGIKAYDALNNRDYAGFGLNALKVGADIGTTFFLKATPIGLGISLGYAFFDLQTSK